MARGRGLTAAALLACARVALAADACEEGRLFSGVALSAVDGGVAVAAVDAESPAAAGGLRVGDRLVQANADVLRDCDDWARAVRGARRERMALLLLVRRAGAEVPLALAADTWQRSVAIAPVVPPAEAPPPVAEEGPPPTVEPGPPVAGHQTPPPTAPPPPTPPPPPPPRARPRPAEAPSVGAVVTAPPPPALPAGTQGDVDEIVAALEAMAATSPRARIETYRQQLLRVHRQLESVAAREETSPRVVAGLRTVVRYFDAAEVAWAAEEEARERERRPDKMPSPEGLTAPYFIDTDAETTLLEFPFLRETIVREPGTGFIQVGGLWRPVQARSLLWEKGRAELTRLTEWLRSGANP